MDVRGISGPKTYSLDCFFVPGKTEDSDENGESHEICILHTKTRVLVLRTPKITTMTKMAGVTQAKPWFTESGVLTTPTDNNFLRN